MDKITYYTNSGEFIADKLLPCPFCGGEPEFITVGNYHTKSRKAEIECTKCHVRRTTGAIRNDLEWCGRKAIELWNARWQKSSHESAALTLHSVKHRICANCGWMDYLKWSDGKPICTCGMFYISDINTFSCNAFMTKDEYEKEFGV